MRGSGATAYVVPALSWRKGWGMVEYSSITREPRIDQSQGTKREETER